MKQGRWIRSGRKSVRVGVFTAIVAWLVLFGFGDIALADNCNVPSDCFFSDRALMIALIGAIAIAGLVFFGPGAFFAAAFFASDALTVGTGIDPLTGARVGRLQGILGMVDPTPGNAVSRGSKAVRGIHRADDAGDAAGKASRGAANRATYEKYRRELRKDMSEPYVQHPELAKQIKILYRKNAEYGSGSTAAAVRHELETGERVRNSLHSEKARGMINYLEKWLRMNPEASPGDRAAAENVILDMRDALNGP